MSFLGFLHNYGEGALIKSSDWNDELNQLVAALGSAQIANPNVEFLFKDLNVGIDNPVLKLENLSTGNILELLNNNATLSSFIRNNGQIDLGANGIVGLIVASSTKCPNLNADLLNGKHSTDLETKIYSMHSFSSYWQSNIIENGDYRCYIPQVSGQIITKIKAQQQGVASADASTVITVTVNGLTIGTVSIAGNTTAVQSNDIADVPLNANDVVSFLMTTYSGGTKHTYITASIHYKNKYST